MGDFALRGVAMTVAVICQARMTSTRLPCKMMLSLAGKPVIRHVLERCQEIGNADDVVLAVPNGPESVPLGREAEALGVAAVGGPEFDVLSRYMLAATYIGADIILRVTGDCPLLDPNVCERVLEPVIAGKAEYVSNVLPRGFPKGLDCEAFTFETLTRASVNAEDDYDREHVTPWMQRADIRRVNIDGDQDPEVRLVLDTVDDYLYLSGLM